MFKRIFREHCSVGIHCAIPKYIMCFIWRKSVYFCKVQFFNVFFEGVVSLYISCVLWLRPFALFNDILSYLSKKKKVQFFSGEAGTFLFKLSL